MGYANWWGVFFCTNHFDDSYGSGKVELITEPAIGTSSLFIHLHSNVGMTGFETEAPHPEPSVPRHRRDYMPKKIR